MACCCCCCCLLLLLTAAYCCSLPLEAEDYQLPNAEVTAG
jgi:hypothetical protein